MAESLEMKAAEIEAAFAKLDNPNKRSRGRPKGSKSKPKPVIYKRTTGRPSKDGRPSFEALVEQLELKDQMPPIYKCMCCGKLTTTATGKFFMNKHMTWCQGNDYFAPICSDCLKALFDNIRSGYNEKLAVVFCSALCGKYYNEKFYDQQSATGEPLELGKYFSTLNLSQYRDKTFLDYLKEAQRTGQMFGSRNETEENQEGTWSRGDRQNKLYVIQCVGYDPFEDMTYNAADRRYLFNTLSAYLTEDVVESPHKVTSVIAIVKSLWQIEKITQVTNAMLIDPNPDEASIQKLLATKSNLQSTINSLAKDNAISASGSGKRATHTNTLSGMMKAMINDGFDDVKANVIDAQMTETYKTIASLSSKALCAEMSFTSDEYAKMVAEQSETIQEQSQKLLEQEEEIRKLKLHLEKYTNPKKAKERQMLGGDG